MPALYKKLILIIGTIVFVLVLVVINTSKETEYNFQVGKDHVEYEKARIVRIISEDIEDHPTVRNLKYGFQEFKVELLTGQHAGEIYTVTNYLSNRFNVYGKEGMTIAVGVDSGGDANVSVFVYNYHREPVLFALIILFIVAISFIGGKKGIKSILGILFTLGCIIFFLLPLLFRGYSPIMASVIMVALATTVTLYLLNGWSRKTSAAIIGTILGVGLAGFISSAASFIANLTGYNMDEAEMMIVISTETGLQVQGLLFAGILIATLGAVMDISMSVASAVHEIYANNNQMKQEALFTAGLNVGRDMMGTMANTLILAFVGVSLNFLLLLYAYDISYYQLVNMNAFVIEVVQGISASTAIVLTVPIVAFVSSKLIPQKKQIAQMDTLSESK